MQRQRDRPATLRLDAVSLPRRAWRDLFSGERFDAAGGRLAASMAVYQVRWLMATLVWRTASCAGGDGYRLHSGESAAKNG